MAGLSIDDQAEVLSAFLRGDASVDELRDRLRDHLSISEIEGGLRIDYHVPLDASIAVTPDALRPMLDRFIGWGCEEDDVEQWANLVTMIDAYGNPPDLTDDEADELMDPVWSTLADLSAPALLGISVRERVERALIELRAVQLKLSRRAV